MERTPTIAVLTGGLATRLGELTHDTPKALLDVCGRPFLAWQLELFAAAGLTDVVLCVGHHAEQIEDWVARHLPAGLRVRFSHDGAQPLGTGGAIRRALDLLGDVFFVAYGDSYLRCDYTAIHGRFLEARRTSTGAVPLGLMTIYRNEDRFDTSNVVFRDGRIVLYDKRHRTPEMQYIDWGVGVLTRAAFADFEDERPFDLAQIYEALVRANRLAGLEMHERFYEVGSHAGLQEFRQYIDGSHLRPRS